MNGYTNHAHAFDDLFEGANPAITDDELLFLDRLVSRLRYEEDGGAPTVHRHKRARSTEMTIHT